MSLITFPTADPIANVLPTNGNTVPIFGAQAITNVYELKLYTDALYENIHNGDGGINFGGITGILPTCKNSLVSSLVDGSLYVQTVSFTPLRPDWSTFPGGGKLWKQALVRLPAQAGASGFNV